MVFCGRWQGIRSLALDGGQDPKPGVIPDVGSRAGFGVVPPSWGRENPPGKKVDPTPLAPKVTKVTPSTLRVDPTFASFGSPRQRTNDGRNHPSQSGSIIEENTYVLW
jgi:hypothetical protein